MAPLDVPLSGRIPPGELAEEGRVLGRLTDIGWGNRLRTLFADASDEPVPDDVFEACVRVLAAWEWPVRPAGVVTVASRHRPRLPTSLGERIATTGRLPLLGTVQATGDTSPRANSAQRVAALWHGLRLPDDLAARVAGLAGPVLLVDDRVDTGWTMALATRLLRTAGAPGVLPFALATTT
jgi:ATP-dependent DNA helicase RecQ